MDITSLIGFGLGIFAVFGGAMMEGLPLDALLQGTAFVIVIGGTLGAIMLHGTQRDLTNALQGIGVAFLGTREKPAETAKQLVDLSLKARKEGILALQSDISSIQDPFMKKGLELMTDGTDPQLLRELLETELGFYEEECMAAAKIWESAGGYSPTIGIIGAVLGLIHVMQNIADPAKLGAGIAVAFVATVYGVGAANLIFMPMGNKIKAKRRGTIMTREMMIEGILSIQAGESPNFIAEKLKIFDPARDPKKAVSAE